MKNQFRHSVFKKILFLLLLACSSSAFAQYRNAINYTSFFAKQDLVFDSLSTKWEEGAFLGNGLLGVMVYKEDENAIRFDLGRTDVVDHREGINPSIGRARMPIGKFVLRFKGKIQKINLRLDLWNAELRGTITTTEGVVQFKGLVAAKNDVIVLKTNASNKNLIYQWDWKPEKSISPYLTLGKDSAAKYPANPTYSTSTQNNINYTVQPLLAGGSYTTAWKKLGNTNDNTLLITIANTYPQNTSKQKAQAILTPLKVESIATLTASHRNYWHQFYQKSFISIPDSRLQSFWWIQQYKMASATRVGAYPIDLMGPWYKASPWPKYWWNLNIQLTYYPFFSSNHIDLAKPLLIMLRDNLPNLSKNAPQPYQHNSAAIGRSGPYAMTGGVKVVKGNDSIGNSAASLELGNLTWLLHVAYQSYEYTMDKENLKLLYPILKRSINYYINVMDKQSDGKYHLPYTYSPEYPKGITRDANYDLAVLKWGAKTLLYMNKELQLKDELAPKWQDMIDNLVPYPQDKLGFRIGRDADFSLSHRHYSHLLQVYPIYDINWDQLENRTLIKQSLDQWEKNSGAWRGYSYTGSGSIYAMMGNGNKTHQLLNEMMKGRFSIKPNTMYTEAGPVIETPLSAVTTINEMLLQSWNGILRIFPAVPDDWKAASFDKLLAKGAFEVSAVRSNGKTQFVKIKSLAGQPLLVKTDWTAPVKASGKRVFKVTPKDNGVITIDLKKGEEVILYTGTKPTSFVMNAITVNDNNNNYWGLHAQK
ncbi:glycosyl hydrolase family 95 catalytic domain-containing protein [Pedobacter sp. UC225_61]|uniref:glycosyl hydrolase family 95 catalytic domain-containing protein n=1 Tax=Pedobacter sp. UC225_61 TaxID=3374623 RepID=UPI0037942A96